MVPVSLSTRQGRAVYRAAAPAVLSPPREFTLTATEAPAAARANDDGHMAGGNGHRDPAVFPWGGEDQ